MEIFTEHLFSWSILTLILAYLVYTSIVIKEENLSYIENAKQINLQNYSFLVPSWWKNNKKTEDELTFIRSDQNYDWKSFFKIYEFNDEDLLEFYAERLKELTIFLDEKDSIVLDDQHLRYKFKNISPNKIVHIESMGTENSERRIYLSSYIIQIENKIILANSLSSVLNGMLEGPYFEQVVYSLEKIKN